ncbi:MAG: hypothetical protein L3J52_10030 [Proteobacteria bacterium]|nr:hypothetical protein [Pseudomonadota bacterium]
MKIFVNMVLFCGFLGLIACSTEPKDKQQQLLSTIENMELAAENRNLSDFMEFFSEDFSNVNGRKIADVRRLVMLQFMRHQKLFIITNIKNIQWHDDLHATVDISAALAGRPMNESSLLASIRADMITLKVSFSKQGEDFMVTSATWQHASPTDFL